MKDNAFSEAVPDANELPALGDNLQLFNAEITSWFSERRAFLESQEEATKYAAEFGEMETNILQDFAMWATRHTLLPEEAKNNNDRREVLEWKLGEARKIYHRALNHLGKTDFLKKKKPIAARVKYDRKRGSIYYYNSESRQWQEQIISHNSNLAYLSQEVYRLCRQKNSSCTPKQLHDFLRKTAPKCSSWEVYESDPIRCWHQVSDTVRSLNRWAETRSFPQLLKCMTKRVTRLL